MAEASTTGPFFLHFIYYYNNEFFLLFYCELMFSFICKTTSNQIYVKFCQSFLGVQIILIHTQDKNIKGEGDSAGIPTIAWDIRRVGIRKTENLSAAFLAKQ